jgi:hypothetical protein
MLSPKTQRPPNKKEKNMKVRMRRDVGGNFNGIEWGLHPKHHLLSVARGDVVEIDSLQDVLRYLKIDLVELRLEGEFGRGDGHNIADIARIQKQVDAEKAKAAAASGMCQCGCNQLARAPEPRGVVSRLKAAVAS